MFRFLTDKSNATILCGRVFFRSVTTDGGERRALPRLFLCRFVSHLTSPHLTFPSLPFPSLPFPLPLSPALPSSLPSSLPHFPSPSCRALFLIHFTPPLFSSPPPRFFRLVSVILCSAPPFTLFFGSLYFSPFFFSVCLTLPFFLLPSTFPVAPFFASLSASLHFSHSTTPSRPFLSRLVSVILCFALPFTLFFGSLYFSSIFFSVYIISFAPLRFHSTLL